MKLPIVASELAKTYGSGDTAVHAVNKISLLCKEGDVVGLFGPSGSGKTTRAAIKKHAVQHPPKDLKAQDQQNRAAAWLEAAGVRIPRKPDGSLDCKIELAPAKFLDKEDVLAAAATLTPPEPGGTMAYE